MSSVTEPVSPLLAADNPLFNSEPDNDLTLNSVDSPDASCQYELAFVDLSVLPKGYDVFNSGGTDGSVPCFETVVLMPMICSACHCETKTADQWLAHVKSRKHIAMLNVLRHFRDSLIGRGTAGYGGSSTDDSGAESKQVIVEYSQELFHCKTNKYVCAVCLVFVDDINCHLKSWQHDEAYMHVVYPNELTRIREESVNEYFGLNIHLYQRAIVGYLSTVLPPVGSGLLDVVEVGSENEFVEWIEKYLATINLSLRSTYSSSEPGDQGDSVRSIASPSRRIEYDSERSTFCETCLVATETPDEFQLHCSTPAHIKALFLSEVFRAVDDYDVLFTTTTTLKLKLDSQIILGAEFLCELCNADYHLVGHVCYLCWKCFGKHQYLDLVKHFNSTEHHDKFMTAMYGFLGWKPWLKSKPDHLKNQVEVLCSRSQNVPSSQKVKVVSFRKLELGYPEGENTFSDSGNLPNVVCGVCMTLCWAHDFSDHICSLEHYVNFLNFCSTDDGKQLQIERNHNVNDEISNGGVIFGEIGRYRDVEKSQLCVVNQVLTSVKRRLISAVGLGSVGELVMDLNALTKCVSPPTPPPTRLIVPSVFANHICTTGDEPAEPSRICQSPEVIDILDDDDFEPDTDTLTPDEHNDVLGGSVDDFTIVENLVNTLVEQVVVLENPTQARRQSTPIPGRDKSIRKRRAPSNDNNEETREDGRKQIDVSKLLAIPVIEKGLFYLILDNFPLPSSVRDLTAALSIFFGRSYKYKVQKVHPLYCDDQKMGYAYMVLVSFGGPKITLDPKFVPSDKSKQMERMFNYINVVGMRRKRLITIHEYKIDNDKFLTIPNSITDLRLSGILTSMFASDRFSADDVINNLPDGSHVHMLTQRPNEDQKLIAWKLHGRHLILLTGLNVLQANRKMRENVLKELVAKNVKPTGITFQVWSPERDDPGVEFCNQILFVEMTTGEECTDLVRQHNGQLHLRAVNIDDRSDLLRLTAHACSSNSSTLVSLFATSCPHDDAFIKATNVQVGSTIRSVVNMMDAPSRKERTYSTPVSLFATSCPHDDALIKTTNVQVGSTIRSVVNMMDAPSRKERTSIPSCISTAELTELLHIRLPRYPIYLGKELQVGMSYLLVHGIASSMDEEEVSEFVRNKIFCTLRKNAFHFIYTVADKRGSKPVRSEPFIVRFVTREGAISGMKLYDNRKVDGMTLRIRLLAPLDNEVRRLTVCRRDVPKQSKSGLTLPSVTDASGTTTVMPTYTSASKSTTSSFLQQSVQGDRMRMPPPVQKPKKVPPVVPAVPPRPTVQLFKESLAFSLLPHSGRQLMVQHQLRAGSGYALVSALPVEWIERLLVINSFSERKFAHSSHDLAGEADRVVVHLRTLLRKFLGHFSGNLINMVYERTFANEFEKPFCVTSSCAFVTCRSFTEAEKVASLLDKSLMSWTDDLRFAPQILSKVPLRVTAVCETNFPGFTHYFGVKPPTLPLAIRPPLGADIGRQLPTSTSVKYMMSKNLIDQLSKLDKTNAENSSNQVLSYVISAIDLTAPEQLSLISQLHDAILLYLTNTRRFRGGVPSAAPVDSIKRPLDSISQLESESKKSKFDFDATVSSTLNRSQVPYQRQPMSPNLGYMPQMRPQIGLLGSQLSLPPGVVNVSSRARPLVPQQHSGSESPITNANKLAIIKAFLSAKLVNKSASPGPSSASAGYPVPTPRPPPSIEPPPPPSIEPQPEPQRTPQTETLLLREILSKITSDTLNCDHSVLIPAVTRLAASSETNRNLASVILSTLYEKKEKEVMEKEERNRNELERNVVDQLTKQLWPTRAPCSAPGTSWTDQQFSQVSPTRYAVPQKPVDTGNGGNSLYDDLDSLLEEAKSLLDD